MAYYYANHPGMATLQMPYCPTPPPPPPQADATYAATAAMRATYRRPQSIQISDTPYYEVDPATLPPLTPSSKRRREDSPEQRHASMSPRPDRQRVRVSAVPRVEVLPAEEAAVGYYCPQDPHLQISHPHYHNSYGYEHTQNVVDHRRMPMTPVSHHSRSRSHTPHVIESVEKAEWEDHGYTYGSGPLLTVAGECDYRARIHGPMTPYSRSPSPSPPTRTNSGDSVQIIGERRVAHTPPQEDQISRELKERKRQPQQRPRGDSDVGARQRPRSKSVVRRHEVSDREYDADCASESSHTSTESRERPRPRSGTNATEIEKRHSYVGRSRADTESSDRGRGRERSSAHPPLSSMGPRLNRSSSVGASVSSRGSKDSGAKVSSGGRKREGSISRSVSFKPTPQVVQYQI